jgi:hypothetical protein
MREKCLIHTPDQLSGLAAASVSGSTVTTDPTTEGTGPHGPLAHTYCLCSDPLTALIIWHSAHHMTLLEYTHSRISPSATFNLPTLQIDLLNCAGTGSGHCQVQAILTIPDFPLVCIMCHCSSLEYCHRRKNLPRPTALHSSVKYAHLGDSLLTFVTGHCRW